ncbi:larval cuticle protein A3A-like [Anthonomus grandis grandis]|uniref:larval cuticle protein A3A-like n=1 Tax=Anthonomus grandis grandis TaxID=2921223 RepID=UPI00216609DE|nr:larval cuticle protein A3A-like [Anthonomus grandis grandis]
MAFVFLLLALTLASAKAVVIPGNYGGHLGAAPHYNPGGPLAYATGDHGHDIDYYAHPRYNYNYGISDSLTGDNKAQTEYRDGDVVKGSYSVAEPDGSIRVVSYTSDDVHGFNAVVKKIGPSYHPAKVAAPLVIGGGVGAYGHGVLGGYYKH